MTKYQEAVTAMVEAMLVQDSGPVGSELFAIHSAEFAEGYRNSAQAALTAALQVLREPSGDMKFAGQSVIAEDGLTGRISVSNEVWLAMLDALGTE